MCRSRPPHRWRTPGVSTGKTSMGWVMSRFQDLLDGEFWSNTVDDSEIRRENQLRLVVGKSHYLHGFYTVVHHFWTINSITKYPDSSGQLVMFFQMTRIICRNPAGSKTTMGQSNFWALVKPGRLWNMCSPPKLGKWSNVLINWILLLYFWNGLKPPTR